MRRARLLGGQGHVGPKSPHLVDLRGLLGRGSLIPILHRDDDFEVLARHTQLTIDRA
jgi:hypothetical protein